MNSFKRVRALQIELEFLRFFDGFYINGYVSVSIDQGKCCESLCFHRGM